MRGVLLFAALGCSANRPPQTPASEAPAPETSWDRGTFVVVEQTRAEEKFEIFRSPDGYRIEVDSTRPVGEQLDVSRVVLRTDARFTPTSGEMTSTIGGAVTRSTIQREMDGRLTTEVIDPTGAKTTAHSTRRNDWFLGGSITTFLVALCNADAAQEQAIVYPDKETRLSPPRALDIAGRKITVRVLEYEQTHTKISAVCEDGKLMGEVAPGTTIVRRGDTEVARALEELR